MRIRSIHHLAHVAAASMALLAALPAAAAIAPAITGNGELFLAVQDPAGEVSYTLDLGVRMDDFFVLGQQDAGYQRFWEVNSPNWTTFLSGVADRGTLNWSVMAGDSTGNTAPGAQRLFTTFGGYTYTGNLAVDRAAVEARLRATTNGNFSNGNGSTQAGSFYTAVNTTGTHAPATDIAVNGDSVNARGDPGASYFGESGGTGPTLNGAFGGGMSSANPIGVSSWFYYFTRSGSATGGFILWEEFDNGQPGPNNTPGPGFDGYWGFVYVEPTNPNPPSWAIYDPNSIYAGKWVLSYTLGAFSPVTTASFREFAQGIGRTEYSGGFQIQHLAGAAAGSPLEAPALVPGVVALGLAGDGAIEMPLDMAAVTAVPEPATWLMWLAALGLLGQRLARRRA